MRFVVLADTHVRSTLADPGDFPANLELAGRNQYAVELIERASPEFVIHLGDVVHPVPGDSDHAGANDLAGDAYAGLTMPLFVAPGNHDVGDKPYEWVDAPSVAEDHYRDFIDRWGPRYQSFASSGCRFVLLDTPVLNTGWESEAAQWIWLERTLSDASAAGERIFMFGHYPPYLWEADEQEHYDNLAPAVRTRLLDLISRHRVEAVFSGHVHRFFHCRHGVTDLYVVPATGFVRPGYSEFDSIAPDDQYGRDDRAKLGLFVVETQSERHRVFPVRTWGRAQAGQIETTTDSFAPGWSTRLGVTMRHGWAASTDMTMDGLDEFVRKRARDDAPVLALWEARITNVRIPAADLEHADTHRRISELAAGGTRFTVLVPGQDRLVGLPQAEGIDRWEIVLPVGTTWDGEALRPPAGLIAVGPVVPLAGAEWKGGHFVAHGFDPRAEPDTVKGIIGQADEAVFRVGPDQPVWESVASAVETATQCGVKAVVNVQLPRLAEGRIFRDDAAVANRVVESEIAARAHPGAVVLLDGFVDHDRGYYPRHALLDRRGDPRDAFRALVRLAAGTEPDGWELETSQSTLRAFTNGSATVLLASETLRFTQDPLPISLVDPHRPATKRLSAGPWKVIEGPR